MSKWTALDAYLRTPADVIARRTRQQGTDFPRAETHSRKRVDMPSGTDYRQNRAFQSKAEAQLAPNASTSTPNAMWGSAAFQEATQALNSEFGVAVRVWECAVTLAGLRTQQQVFSCVSSELESRSPRPASLLRWNAPLALYGGGRMRGRHLLPKLHANPIERASFAAAPVTAWLLRSLAGCIVASRKRREVSGTRTTRGEWIPQSRVTAQIGRSSRQSSMPVSA